MQVCQLQTTNSSNYKLDEFVSCRLGRRINEGKTCPQGKEGGNVLWRVGWVMLAQNATIG